MIFGPVLSCRPLVGACGPLGRCPFAVADTRTRHPAAAVKRKMQAAPPQSR
jgi:hypothetical protein